MLKVPDGMCGRVSVERFAFGKVFPGRLEDPAHGGYSILEPGARFTSLSRVRQADGGWADLSVYPAREGYEDIVLLACDRSRPVSWTALCVPDAGYVWYALKDPNTFPSTLFWISNGGRHYAPWNGRHRRVIGLEEVVANFHLGLAESARPNLLSRTGVPTYFELKKGQPKVINYVMGVVRIPPSFDAVSSIHISPDKDSLELISSSGVVARTRTDVPFLQRESLLSEI
jgi:hypothetical protein